MKTKFLLCLFILSMAPAVLMSQEKTKKELKEEKRLEQQKQIEAMINDTLFVFSARTTNSTGARGGNLSGDNYYVNFSPALIQSNLPFYGRAYSGVAYGGDTGLRFEGKPTRLTIEKTKKGFLVNAVVSANNDNFNLSLNVGSEGNSTLVVYSNNRSSMSFSGEIVKPKK